MSSWIIQHGSNCSPVVTYIYRSLVRDKYPLHFCTLLRLTPQQRSKKSCSIYSALFLWLMQIREMPQEPTHTLTNLPVKPLSHPQKKDNIVRIHRTSLPPGRGIDSRAEQPFESDGRTANGSIVRHVMLINWKPSPRPRLHGRHCPRGRTVDFLETQ